MGPIHSTPRVGFALDRMNSDTSTTEKLLLGNVIAAAASVGEIRSSESQLRSVLRTGLAYTDKLRIFFVLDR